GATRAVVLGGGYIGLEMAEVLRERGLEVTVVLADPVPMAQLDTDMGERVCKAMGDMGFDMQTGQPVREIEVDADAVVRAARTDANKQGRIAGSVIGGRPARFAGVLGTALTKVGELEIARTGLCTTQAEDGGYDYRTETIEGTTKAGYYPGATPMAIKLLSER